MADYSVSVDFTKDEAESMLLHADAQYAIYAARAALGDESEKEHNRRMQVKWARIAVSIREALGDA